MKLSSLTLLVCLAATPSAMAQALTRQHGSASAVKHAGTYHVASDTWTRSKSPIAMLGTDVLYDNTCTLTAYGFISPGETFVDSGRLPSTSSPTDATSLTGSSNSYLIDGFDTAYCTGEAAIDINYAFYQCYAACSDASGLVPDAAFAVTGFPGVGTGTASLGCWILTIDLSLTSAGFNLAADCEGTFDGLPSIDNFGWSFEIVTTPVSGVGQGPIISGDPFNLLGGGQAGVGCPYGDGTTWAANGTTEGTGLGTGDSFEVDVAGAILGCGFYGGYFNGGNYSSFFLRLHGDAGGAPPVTGTQFCAGDGFGTACPCGNNNDGTSGFAGCSNGVNTGGAALSGSGNPSIANDSVTLSATGLQSGQPGLFFQADNAINSGNGITFGDGLRCAGGNIVRLSVVNADGTGTALSPTAIGALLTAGDIKRYQYWYRNPLNSACGFDFNLTNGFEISWSL